MDRKRIMEKNPADWSEEEQLFIIEQTDNSLKPDDEKVEQPEQSPDWQPDPNEVVKDAHERHPSQG